MTKYKKAIPLELRKSVKCKTVGDVIDHLKKLPRGLGVSAGFEGTVDIGIAHVNEEYLQLSFRDPW